MSEIKVETFDVENFNSEAQQMAQDSEALELIEKLGLDGQKSLSNPKTATRNPYRAMEKREEIVYKALLTKHSTIEKYNADIIPLRVLQVAAHANEIECFRKLEVWYAEPYVLRDDPILVGLLETQNDWGGNETTYYLLARWGKALQTLEQLEAIALNTLRKARLDNLNAILNEVKSRLTTAEQTNDLEWLSSKPQFCP